MQIKKVHGIITSIRPHQELDRIISVFSHEFGRIRVFAKGVRKITSRRGFHLDVLNDVSLELEEPGLLGDYGPLYLREVTIKNHYQAIKKNPTHFASACLIARFLERILPENFRAHEMLDLTRESFQALSSSENSSQVLLAFFSKTLRMLGHIPNSLPKDELRQTVHKVLNELDPQLTLNARRTLGMFSNLDSIRSN